MTNRYTTFNKKQVDVMSQPMFLGENVNVARYDQQKHKVFEKLIEKQLSFFWRPEEVDVSKDRIDFNTKMTDAERHIFISNLKYQTLLDSVQGRSPNVALLPLVSLPELETWIETWSFSETIHSRSYTHILRNLYTDPSVVFDDIVSNEHIQRRATDISKYYDDLIFHTQLYQTLGEGVHVIDGEEYEVTEYLLRKKLYLALHSVHALEAVRFYVSFACTFAFAKRELMEGNSKIVKLIARDENLHMVSTHHMLSLMISGQDHPDFVRIHEECKDEATAIFVAASEQEKEWAKYLFKDGSMIGLNEQILCDYIEFITEQRMGPVGLECPYAPRTNPLPWMNDYLNSDNFQVAPQEAEISSYLVGQVDADVGANAFDDFSFD